MNAYYLVGNGLGNIIQTTPAYLYLQQKYGDVTVVTHPKWREFVNAVYLGYPITSESIAGKQNVYRCCNPNDFKHQGSVSEVDLNLWMVRDCIGEIDYSDNKSGFCGFQEMEEEFDFLICNGYNKRRNQTDWLVKSYPYWNVIAQELTAMGYRVASVGTDEEYVPGTVDRTGIGLLETLGLIKNCKVLLSNDTGFYHAANVLKTRCIVVFTMTDQDKNYDPTFHRYTDLICTNLPCQPCQLKEKTFWLKNKEVCKWACRNVPPEDILALMKKRRYISG